MNRRSILALLGGAAVVPAVGVKAAASALGVETALLAGSGNVEIAECAPSAGGWWGSPLQIAIEARERVHNEMVHGKPYPHMKSWGHGFRRMVAERDAAILMAYRQKMQEDSDFRDRVFAALGLAK